MTKHVSSAKCLCQKGGKGIDTNCPILVKVCLIVLHIYYYRKVMEESEIKKGLLKDTIYTSIWYLGKKNYTGVLKWNHIITPPKHIILLYSCTLCCCITIYYWLNLLKELSVRMSQLCICVVKRPYNDRYMVFGVVKELQSSLV